MKKYEEAVVYLRTTLLAKWKEDELKMAQKLLAQYGDQEWFWHIYDKQIAECKQNWEKAIYNPHFSFGMGVRNFLRQGGFAEKDMEVENLDDVYIPLLTEALKGY